MLRLKCTLNYGSTHALIEETMVTTVFHGCRRRRDKTRQDDTLTILCHKRVRSRFSWPCAVHLWVPSRRK